MIHLTTSTCLPQQICIWGTTRHLQRPFEARGPTRSHVFTYSGKMWNLRWLDLEALWNHVGVCFYTHFLKISYNKCNFLVFSQLYVQQQQQKTFTWCDQNQLALACPSFSWTFPREEVSNHSFSRVSPSLHGYFFEKLLCSAHSCLYKGLMHREIVNERISEWFQTLSLVVI